jgi:pancreatic triacylglycerol lipase
LQVAASGYKLLKAVIEATGLDLRKMTIVGHSMGAHIATTIIEMFNNQTNHSQVAILIALDPAGTYYRSDKGKKIQSYGRLRKGVAGYTMVIHTNAYIYGWEAVLGDADFFPNGGKFQPYCVQTYKYFGDIYKKLSKYLKLLNKSIQFLHLAMTSNFI